VVGEIKIKEGIRTVIQQVKELLNLLTVMKAVVLKKYAVIQVIYGMQDVINLRQIQQCI